ncbi:hypothetical protein, conserved [Leishmania tarentolae]|uniref:Uncharacterized protein n=1 Tax=Leishmania tarentolae TaxID=5689 RepID=A0A640KLE5_LEITA|nr:hypothetical protein, conserved [Leishmania tarentolae]
MQTKVCWVVRPSGRLAAACSSSSDSSDSIAARRGLRSAVGCSDTSGGVRAAAAACKDVPNSSYPSADSPDVEDTWGKTRVESSGRRDSDRGQPHHATKGEFLTVPAGRPHLLQPHSGTFHNAARYDRHEDHDGDAGTHDAGGAVASEDPPEQQLGEPRHRRYGRKYKQSDTTKSEEWRPVPRKKCRGNAGDEKTENDCVSPRTQTSDEEAEERLRESSPLTSEAARRRHAVPRRLATPFGDSSSMRDEASLRQSSSAAKLKAAPSKRDPSRHSGDPKGDHLNAASPSSPITLEGASRELSSSLSSSFSSPSSLSDSNGSDSDVAELVASLSPSTRQRAWQLLRLGNAASLPAHFADELKGTTHAPDSHQQHEPHLAAVTTPATQRLTNAFTAGQGSPEAQVGEEREAPLGYLPAFPLSASVPQMPQNVGVHGTAPAKTPMADILSVMLTGVPGGDNDHATASVNNENSAAHGPHHHHYRPLGTRAAVQLPRTLLALYAMSLRAASRSVVAPPVNTFDEHVSDHDGDAVQPPLKQSVPLTINEANSEVGQPRSPSDHPYNLGGPTCSSISGRRGWGGFHPSLGAKLVGRESGGANEESMVAGLPSTERYDGCLSRAHEPATTSTHSIDEGRVQQGTGTPVGESSAVQGPLLSPSVRSQVKLEAMESSDEGLPMHTAEVAQSHSAISDATSGAARDTHRVHSGGAAAEERDVLGAAEAMGSDANEGQLVGGIAPEAASTSHAAAMWAPNSLPSATGSASTATRTGAGALVPSGTVPEHYKAVSDSPGVVLPSTNRLPMAPSSALSSGVPPSAKSADAIEPKSAPTQLHVDPLQGPMLNVDPAVERRPLSFDQNTCTATPITRADSKSGDSALLWPLHSGEGQYGVKTTRATPQSALRSTRGAVAPGFGAAWRDASGSSGTALVPATESLNAPSYTTVVTSRADGTGAFLYDLPSLTIPVLHAKGDRGSLGKDMPRRAYNQHLGERRFAKEATAEVAVATGSGNAPSSAPSSLLPAAECNQSSPETFAHPQQPTLGDHPPRPFRLPRMRDVEASVCNFDVNNFARSLTQQPSAAEASAPSDALPPTSAGTAKTVSCLPQCLVPTAHPYCCATLKGAAGGEPNPRRDARIAASDLAATALRSILPARAALGEGVEDSTLNRTSAPFTAVTPFPEEAEAALDASPLSSSLSSYSHTSSVGVHPNRRQTHHRRYRDRSAGPQESQRDERKKRRSRQGSCGEGDASLGHHRQHRHHRGGCHHEKDGKHKTRRLPHRRHHCSREKQRLSRHREGRPQAENTRATAAPQSHHPLLSKPEAAPQQGHRGVRSCDAAYIAQGELRRGKDHYGQPAADHGDDTTRATRQHPSHRCSGSKALHIGGDAGDDNAAPKRRRHQRHGERERTRGDRHCGQRMPSASILSKSSLSSRSIRSGSSVSRDGDSEMLSADFTRRGRSAAWVSVLQSKAGEVAPGPGSGGIPGEGKGEMGAPVRSPSDNVEHSVEAPLRQRMILSETRPEERGAQPRSHREWRPETQDSRITRADAYVPEISGPSANTKAGGDASSYDPMRGGAVGGKDACNTDSYQPPELVGSKQATTQELPGRDGDGTSLSRASPASASASGRHAPDAQAQCSVAHGSACASTEKLGRPRRPSMDAVTTGMAREQDAANGQRALPQHGDVFYSDSAGRFHRVSGVELPRVLEGDMGWRTSPERSQSLCGRGRRPLFVVHNPAPTGCAITGRQARRAWTITNPTNSLSCGRLNPYCSSCRAKYNLMFVDPQMRPVQWLSAHSAELDQMGDCRIHSGYIFGGGDTEAERDTMLVQQRLRSKRMAAWPELPQSGRDRFIVHEEDLDGPLRQLAPPPQGHFVRIAYEEDMRLPVDKALRRCAPLATASAAGALPFRRHQRCPHSRHGTRLRVMRPVMHCALSAPLPERDATTVDPPRAAFRPQHHKKRHVQLRQLPSKPERLLPLSSQPAQEPRLLQYQGHCCVIHHPARQGGRGSDSGKARVPAAQLFSGGDGGGREATGQQRRRRHRKRSDRYFGGICRACQCCCFAPGGAPDQEVAQAASLA